jgi:sialic acid synthase SpsE
LHHGGSIDRAEDIIVSASRMGATDVKLQYFTERDLIGRTRGHGWDVLARYALSPSAITELQAFAAGQCGVEMGVAFFGIHGARTFRDACGAADWCKIPGNLSHDRKLVEEVRALGKPMVLSFYPHACIENTCNDDVALHCTTTYPTADDRLYLGLIGTLPKMIFKEVGWSCHADARFPTSAELACLAYACGARWFEFHYRDDSVPTDSPDYDVSLWPDLLAYTITQLKKCAEIVGS